MNERIKELAEQVDKEFNSPYDRHKAIERFAQLIVRECALTAGLMEREGRMGIGAQILDNFGVEE